MSDRRGNVRWNEHRSLWKDEKAVAMGTRSPLKIRLLGELQLTRADGLALALPASRKTRALLGYLIATGQAHRRERLCDMFWDGPDDPRAELRWSLSKIRLLFKESEASLVADRQRVGTEFGNAAVDLMSLKSLLSNGVSAAPTEALKKATALFAGEFLDGLDLPSCYLFQEWCMAEREAISRLRLDVLATLIERLQEHPEDALSYARALTVADPLCEAGHAAVVRLLTKVGRHKEALGHYERARRVFETELGAPPGEELEEARRFLQSVKETRASLDVAALAKDTGKLPERVESAAAYFVGRAAEQKLAERLVAKVVKRQASDIMLAIGEAGIGKSHLLGRVADCMLSAGGRVWTGRGFEPEASRPYGIWFDILRTIARVQPREQLPSDLGLLLPELSTASDRGDRSRLFDAVVELLRQVTSQRPAVIVLDDLQWIDEASSALLHYVARRMDAASGLLLICGARPGELEDNAAASGVFRSLSREKRLWRIELGPLSSEETVELIRLVDSALDGARIFVESEGNPLFTLELARAYSRGDTDPGPTIEGLIVGQLGGLSEQAREVLLWAAASGRAFTPDDLTRAARLDSATLLTALGELERRGMLQPVGEDIYDFAHDLVRQTIYRTISQPRRKLFHRNIARALERASARDAAVAAELAYHAALAEDSQAAAQACAAAGERALRLFANVDAASFAERGLRHVERLPDSAEKVETRLSLLKIRILAVAGPGMRPLPPLIETVGEAAKFAEKLGLHAAAATGHYLLSVLYQEAGKTQRAEKSTLRAAAVGRFADEITRAHQLANTARCLLELETEIGQSRELVREGSGIADSLGLEFCELHWARGLLHRWDGEGDMAMAAIGRALALARQDEDRWREYKCLIWLAMIEQELGCYAEVQSRCTELRMVAARLGEDESPFIATLQALAQLAADEAEGQTALADGLRRLRKVDDKSYLAYALNSAAGLHLRAGRPDEARLCAAEALSAASAMRRKNEATIAQAILMMAGGTRPPEAMQDLIPPQSDWAGLSARARSTLLEVRN
jgi:DNA-binding SARP family transcriptional activator